MNPFRTFLSTVVCLLLIAVSSEAQDVITIGSVSAPAGSRVSVPVSIRDVGGTALDVNGAAKIQAFSVRVRVTPAASVTALSFTRAGVTKEMVPLYERTVGATDSLAYIATFAGPIPFLLNGTIPGDRVGTLSLTIGASVAPATVINLIVDATATALSNNDGSQTETVGETNLVLVGGTVTVGGSPTTIALASSANPSVTGQAVTFNAAVTSPTPGPIGGYLSFLLNDVEVAVVKLSGGAGTFTTSTLTEGTHRISAVYEGSGVYRPSTSTAVNQTVNSSLIAAPTGVSAVAASATRVDVAWTSVANAASYEVVRRNSVTGGELVVGTSTGTSLSDQSVTGGTTYLYAVRALTAAGARSSASALDPATTFMFSDASLNGANIRRIHLTELRAAINDFRRAAGLASYPFTENNLPARAVVKRVHIDELRTAVNAARSALGLANAVFADSLLSASVPVRAVHFDGLRNTVR